MRKTLKLTTMLLCITAIATLSSCTKEKFDANELIGTTWKCTYNCTYRNWMENEYVGTIWKLSSEKVPYSEINEYYVYKNGLKTGSYSINESGEICLWQDFVWGIDDDEVPDDDFCDNYYHIEKTNNELVLSKKETNYDGSRSLKVYLKFVQQ